MTSFSTNPVFGDSDPRERGDSYADQSNRLLDLRDVSLATVQACVLLGAFSITRGEAAAESIYYCTACRIANFLDLVNRPSSDAIEREVNIRGMSLFSTFVHLLMRSVWWSLCMIDVWSSTGVNLPRQMQRMENVPLPIDEVPFLIFRRGSVQTLGFNAAFSSASSLLAQMIKLNRILADINSLNARTVAGTSTGVMLENEVMDLSNALNDWHNNIPAYMHDTPSNLQRYAAQGLGRMFVAVYLGYYHFGQLLFYQFLHGDCHSTILSAQFYASKCKFHAEALCEIVYAAHSVPGCDVQYTMVGHILVIASTVQIHTLLFSDNEEQIAAARTRLERNFAIMSQLRTYWPTLDVCFTRLRAFHRACRSSMDEPFRLDQWMLRFLSEFAEPVNDKVVGSSTDMAWSLENIGTSPGGSV